LIGDLELHGPAGFSLHDAGPRPSSPAKRHVIDPQSDQVAAPELAVERQVEQI
jgi:hypothetical protein